MARSINGWKVIGPKDHHMLATGTIPGTHRKLTTRKEVLPFFLALAHDYDKHVTNIDRGHWDEGGYNYRKSRLNTNWSNHSSGTAIDLDWAHEGSRNAKNLEFFDKDHPKHHKGIAYLKHKYGDLVNWGGDWGAGHHKAANIKRVEHHQHVDLGAYDPMHWELKKGTTVADVRRFIKDHHIDDHGIQHAHENGSGYWDGHVPGYDAVIKAEKEGTKNLAAYRVACRLKDLGYFHGEPVKYAQGYPRKAVANWQHAHGWNVHPEGEWGPKAQKLLFG